MRSYRAYEDAHLSYTHPSLGFYLGLRQLSPSNSRYELAKSHFNNKEEGELFQNEFESFLETTRAKSKGPSDEDRTYKDLLRGRFRLTDVTRIEYESYEDGIHGKAADFTSETIRSLIQKGKEDARRVLRIQ